MTASSVVRNFRDGQMTISDGSSTPVESNVLIDEGNISWTETDGPLITRCRGTIIGVRPGDDEPMELSYTVKWTQLIQGTEEASDGHVLYEMINNIGDTYATTSSGHYTLDHTFVVSDPANGTSTDEQILFADVYKTTLVCSEGQEYNSVEFTGGSIHTKPTITRV